MKESWSSRETHPIPTYTCTHSKQILHFKLVFQIIYFTLFLSISFFSLSFSFFKSLSVSLSFSLFLQLSLSVSISICIFLFLYLSLSVYFSFRIYLYLYISLSVSLSLCLYSLSFYISSCQVFNVSHPFCSRSEKYLIDFNSILFESLSIIIVVVGDVIGAP